MGFRPGCFPGSAGLFLSANRMETVTIRLEDWEWDMVDAEAAALGMTRQELMREMLREEAELVLDGMDESFQPTDRQWKSH